MNTARYNITTSATLLFALSINILFMAYSTSPGEKKVTDATTGFAVVELFTSEGCSSCPAADDLLAKVSEEYKGKIYALSFHVDYWNYLGWKDPFSSEAYSKRQQLYGSAFHLNSIYTPQVVVNGRAEFTGSDEDKLKSTLSKQLAVSPAATLTVTAKSMDGKVVNVLYKTNGADNDFINIALVQLHATTQVKRGENGGAVLKHVNVVRDFETAIAIKNTEVKTSFTIPSGLSSKDCKVIIYLQDKKNLQIIAAAETAIE